MTMILLVRHGQNEWVKKKRLAGWIPNIHLNDEGKAQAKAVAERLSHLPIMAVYSSPVTRCMETAAYIGRALNLEISELAAVGEVRYGEWEGEEIEKLSKEKAWYAVQHFPSRFRFPEGEALRQVQARAVDALEALSARHGKREIVVVVSHADLIKLTLAHYLGVHIDLFQRIVISPASVSALALAENGMVRVLRINDDGPLEPPPEKEEESEAEDDDKNEKNA
ncbi:MAG: MSMEG_4193 family putative phosphomutase [Candidatus Promineifilaceae bacterium]|nr:MSMEG_4193 family putative phosphomutase [Candidatus Promineifilaceae bacterium]